MPTAETVVGDEVEWTSQAQARVKTKRGVIVFIVPPAVHPWASGDHLGLYGEPDHPANAFNPAPMRGAMYSLTRRHESYIVAVPTKSGRGRPRLYWPRVSQLRRVR